MCWIHSLSALGKYDLPGYLPGYLPVIYLVIYLLRPYQEETPDPA